MKLKLLLLSATVAAAVAAPAAHAAAVTLADGYVFAGTDTTSFTTKFTTGSPTTTYFELVNSAGFDLPAKVILSDTNPDLKSASYAVYVDNANAVGTADTGASVQSGSLTDIALDSNTPFLQFVMQAGAQYVLALTRTDGSISQIT